MVRQLIQLDVLKKADRSAGDLEIWPDSLFSHVTATSVLQGRTVVGSHSKPSITLLSVLSPSVKVLFLFKYKEVRIKFLYFFTSFIFHCMYSEINVNLNTPKAGHGEVASYG